MFKFFRKIRHQLITANKFSRYLLYAIGEIVLVVIGILIALQVNNFNEAEKEQKQLREYMAKIKSNLEQDIISVTAIKDLRIQINNSCKKAMQNLVEGKYDLEVSAQAMEALIDINFVPNQSGYESLKNSPFLGKITGKKIDRLLDEYYAKVNTILKEEESLNAYIENMEVLLTSNNDMVPLVVLYTGQLEKLKSNTEKYDQINKELEVIFHSNPFKSVVARISAQTLMLQWYDELILIGEKTIQEIDVIIND